MARATVASHTEPKTERASWLQRHTHWAAPEPEARANSSAPGRITGIDLGRVSLAPQGVRPLPAAPWGTTNGALQAKLAIGSVNDPLEREADRVADKVLRMPDPAPTTLTPSGALLSRKCAGCQKDDDDEKGAKVQRRATPGSAPTLGTAGPGNSARAGGMMAPPTVHDVLRSPGKPLDPAARAFMEPRFGYDFSAVRVHTDSASSRSAEDVSARAYTVGHHVVFRQGEYTPNTPLGQRLLAHELAHVIQQSPGEAMLQRAETDTTPDCATVVESKADVNTYVNAHLAAARKSAGPSGSGKDVAKALAKDVGHDTSAGRTAAEDWVENSLTTTTPPKAILPAKSSTKYAGVTYMLWKQSSFPILNPTMKVNGICIGSDKLGHFFQQGWTFRNTEDSSNTAAAEEESERSEGGGYGLATTGVFSNADQEANRQGGRFYKDLIATPGMTFDISTYISSRWNENDNPNFYETSVGPQVWANLLTGGWTGTSTPIGIGVAEAFNSTLSATAGGLFSGSFVHSTSPDIGNLSGTVKHNTTTVRGTNLVGMNTNPSAVTGVTIAFQWTRGTESGHGILDSRGERRLEGSWGDGPSTSGRGVLSLDRS